MTEFLGGLLTPVQRQEIILRKALELRSQYWAHEGFLYRGAGDLLLQHGEFYSGRALPPEYDELRGASGRCFENALDACKSDPSLRYCEGVYAIGASHYTPHAWCLDPAGELLEVTLPTSPEAMAKGIEPGTHQPILPFEHWGYWGAVFHPEYVDAYFKAQKGAGILDRPTQDALFDLAEWRTYWPVYTYPYNPDRRTL